MKRLDQYRLHIEKSGEMLVDATIYTSEKLPIEDEAIQQLKDSTRLPGIRKALATPDIHVGYGVPIGGVVGIVGNIVPAAVGYDINCGMRLMTTPLRMGELDIQRAAHSIGRDVPLGEGKTNIRFQKRDFETLIERGVRGLADVKDMPKRVAEIRKPEEEAEDIANVEEQGSMDGDIRAVSKRALERGIDQLGTLGGGNHFIEIQVVEKVFNPAIAEEFGLWENQLVVMIHTGSRGFGHQIADEYMKRAKSLTASTSPNRNLCYLVADGDAGSQYIKAMQAAANFSFLNRQILAIFVRKNLRYLAGDIPIKTVYDVPHNMAKYEEHGGEWLWVHRKGATRAFPASRMQGTRFMRTGQPVLIPGSMGTASYVLVGTEAASAETLCSVNHGAGRVMSRTRAAGVTRRGRILKEAAISDEEFERSMKGITLICEDRSAIKEESPQAYKDIDLVTEIVVGAGLAEPVAKMRPLAVLKG